MAAGVVGLLTELGCQPVLIGLRGASLGGERAFREALARSAEVLRAAAAPLDATAV